MATRGAGRTRVFVGGVLHHISERDVVQQFEKFGAISRVDVGFQGFCFVEFEELRSAQDAIDALDGRTVNGRHINVQLCEPQVLPTPGPPEARARRRAPAHVLTQRTSCAPARGTIRPCVYVTLDRSNISNRSKVWSQLASPT